MSTSEGSKSGGRPKGGSAPMNAKRAETVREPGRYRADDNLFLTVSPTGSKSWLFIFVIDGRRRSMGLGSFPEIGLARARERAFELRQQVAEGVDPLAEKRQTAAALKAESARPNFGQHAEAFIADYCKPLRNPKHRAQWLSTIKTYAAPLYLMDLDAITLSDVKACLDPIWLEKTETAHRVRGRLELIFNAAIAKGLRTGTNPAAMSSGLKALMPKAPKSKEHHAAMPYAEVPAFFHQLGERPAVAADALRFAILTAARTGETLGATWAEIDLDAGLWTIPASRMKAQRPHVVPLSTPAIEILKRRHKDRLSTSPAEPVFPGQRPMRPASNMAMEMLLRRMKVDVTVHGFRSSFRDFAGDQTDFPREVAEGCLAHAVGNAAEHAYRRGTAIEKRRELMGAWASYITAPPAKILRLSA